MEKNQALYESMKQNKSLAPIAELGALVGDAQRMAQKAEEIGNTLSVFAVKGESAIATLPPAEEWMRICDTYKDGARAFAAKINEAVNASRIGELQKLMEAYSHELVRKTAIMLNEDDDMRNEFIEAVRRRNENAENGPKNAE